MTHVPVRIQPRINSNLFVLTNEERDMIYGIYPTYLDAHANCPEGMEAGIGVVKVSVTEIGEFGFVQKYTQEEIDSGVYIKPYPTPA